MTTVSWRASLTTLAGVALATGLTLAFIAPGASAHSHGSGTTTARNGDNGTVKIHRSTTPVADRANQPHVCTFYLDAFGFDPAQSVSWQIKAWAPTGNRSTVVKTGALTLDGNGNGHTSDMGLANGHYKLFWNFTGEKGFAKQKVFWVKCPAAPTPSPTPSSPSPSASSPSPSASSPSPSASSPSPSVSSPSPSPSPSPTSSVEPAQAPKPVKTTLPVTG